MPLETNVVVAVERKRFVAGDRLSEYISIAKQSDCPPGQCLERVVNGRVIALCNVDGQFFALDGVCPHQGGPLGQGALCGHVLTCPWHGWQFDVRTGDHTISPTLRQPTIPLHLDGGEILVDRRDLLERDSVDEG